MGINMSTYVVVAVALVTRSGVRWLVVSWVSAISSNNGQQSSDNRKLWYNTTHSYIFEWRRVSQDLPSCLNWRWLDSWQMKLISPDQVLCRNWVSSFHWALAINSIESDGFCRNRNLLSQFWSRFWKLKVNVIIQIENEGRIIEFIDANLSFQSAKIQQLSRIYIECCYFQKVILFHYFSLI